MPQLLADQPSTTSLDLPASRKERDVLDGLIALVAREAANAHVPVRKVEVTSIPASDKINARTVVTQHVDLPAEKALAFWDSLSDSTEKWAASLSQEEAWIALDLLAVDIQWNPDATAF